MTQDRGWYREGEKKMGKGGKGKNREVKLGPQATVV